MDLEKLKSELRRDEGFRSYPYLCTAGHKTVGYGHNLDAHPVDAQHYAQFDTHGLSEVQGGNWLDEDINDAAVIANAFVGIDVFNAMNDDRQRALTNMAFVLGTKLFAFTRLRKAIFTGNWVLAAHEILASKFARQVGNRAVRLATLMEGRKEIQELNNALDTRFVYQETQQEIDSGQS